MGNPLGNPLSGASPTSITSLSIVCCLALHVVRLTVWHHLYKPRQADPLCHTLKPDVIMLSSCSQWPCWPLSSRLPSLSCPSACLPACLCVGLLNVRHKQGVPGVRASIPTAGEGSVSGEFGAERAASGMPHLPYYDQDLHHRQQPAQPACSMMCCLCSPIHTCSKQHRW